MASDSPPAIPPRTASLSLRRMVLLFCGFACLPTLVAFAARWWWVAELATHFRVQYAVLMVPFVGWFAAARLWKVLAVPAIVLGVNVAMISPLYLPVDRPEADAPRLRAMVANVLTGNRAHDRILKLVRSERPDFLVALEVDAVWKRSLDELTDEYPHSIARPRSDNFGIAFYSRLPVDDLRIVELADSEVPTVVATVRTESGPLTVVGTHPLPPRSAAYAGHRNRQLAALAELAASIDGPLLLLGDLNATSWSPQFADLVQVSGLRDSRRGFGVQPTWPVQSPLLLIPIDHALVSSEIDVHDRRVGGDIGSDHRPVILEFALELESGRIRPAAAARQASGAARTSVQQRLSLFRKRGEPR